MKDTELYLNAARRGLGWALGRLTPEGSFRGCEAHVAGAYKAPRALAAAGYVREAGLVTAHVGSRFFAGGDFNRGEGDPSTPRGANYRNAWLTWGCQTLGAYELSYPGGDFLELAQHPDLGGLPAQCGPARHTQELDWGTTACGVVAFLAVGRVEQALAAGACLQRMLESQPAPEARLLLVQTWEGDWVASYPPDQATTYALELGRAGQVYWYLGIGMAAFALLRLATAERRWTMAAERVFGLAEACGPDSFEALTAAKVGWGSSLLYHLTKQDRYAAAARRVGEMMVRTQTAEGAWIRRPAYSSLAAQPVALSLDTTLERCLWLYEIARNLTRAPASSVGM